MNRILASTLLISSVLFPAAASASSTSGDANASTPRVSTGVTPPQLINNLNLGIPYNQNGLSIPAGTQVSATFVVDENGQPRNVQIVKGVNQFLDARIATAVQSLRYRPATMDDRAVAIPVNLSINLEK